MGRSESLGARGQILQRAQQLTTKASFKQLADIHETVPIPRSNGVTGSGLKELASTVEGNPKHLCNALCEANQLLKRGPAEYDKRVIIFTRDLNPAGTGAAAGDRRHAHPALACGGKVLYLLSC